MRLGTRGGGQLSGHRNTLIPHPPKITKQKRILECIFIIILPNFENKNNVGLQFFPSPLPTKNILFSNFSDNGNFSTYRQECQDGINPETIDRFPNKVNFRHKF